MLEKYVPKFFFLFALALVSCTTVQRAEAPAPAAAPEPLPEFFFGEPVLTAAPARADANRSLLLQIPLTLHNASTHSYVVQSLAVQATLHRKDQDTSLKLEDIQGLPSAGSEQDLDALSSQAWPLACILPLDAVIEDPMELSETSADTAEGAPVVANPIETGSAGLNSLACTIVAVLHNSQGEEIKINDTFQASLPRIYKPQVQILSIAVKRAELINTRLKVRLSIDNPNPFPLNLTRFSYELYGNGRFWADGSLADLGTIGGKERQEKDIYLVMNFINMKRDLLDQVIALTSVQYRFHGDLTIGTPFEYLPAFPYTFDRSGSSPVIE